MWPSLLSVVLVINELMASNVGEVMSPATNFDSWVELYNPTEQTIDLAGMYLSNDEQSLKMWRMPSGIGSVPAKGFKVVWLGSNDIIATQAPFKLDCDGGVVCLSDKSGQLITTLSYPKAMSRTAYARTTDGGEEWAWTASPTPGATNTTSSFATERLDPPVVSEGSRIISGTLNVKVDIPEGATLMYTTNGSVPTMHVADGPPQEPSWKNWVRNGDCEGEDATNFICRDGDGAGDVPRITDGVGVDGSRAAMVHAIENPVNDWDSQFFIYTPDHVWYAGDQYRFTMKVKADKPCYVSVQSHTTPGGYIHWSMLSGGYNITTKWQTIYYEGTITEEQAGSTGLQTIAFNLNGKAQDNNFYFDDIAWEQWFDPSTAMMESRKSEDGVFTVTKTINYMFRLFKEGYLPSVPVTRSFIKTDNKYTIPVVSIVGNERYFTDPEWGIDVKGTNGKAGNGSDDPVNWNMDWDRPVNFSYISPQDGMLFNQDVNICVSGGWSRGSTPRSMKLKANKVFDGQNHLDYSFFPQKPYIRNKALLLRNGGNDIWNNHARFTDVALATIIQRSGIDLDVQSFVQVAEYINGRFKGIVNLRETNNDKFVYANYGYDDEAIDMFENDTFKNGTKDAYRLLCQLAENSKDASAYEEVKRLLDIDEFVNYMAVELFLGNDDWPGNNVKAFRSQNDGRFRFICFDLDFVFNPWDRNTFNQVLDDYRGIRMISLFLNLLKNDGFCRKFIDTYCIVAGSVFEKERAAGIIDELVEMMHPMAEYDGLTPDDAGRKMKEMFQTRLDVMIERLRQYAPMQLSGVASKRVTLSSDTDGATLFINGVEVPYATFRGTLFAPFTFDAKAPAGYRFVGWRTASEGEYIACFEPLSTEEREAQGITPVCINEVSAANGIYVNEYFKRNDWIELYNTTDAAIDVEGMYLSDNLTKPKKYQITTQNTQQSIIPPHGFLIVWCDKLEPLLQYHASFKLDADGGDVILTAQDESWSNRITYSQHKADETIGRYPDGTANVYVMNVPTIAKPNVTSSYVTEVSQPIGTDMRYLTADVAAALTVRYDAGRLMIHAMPTELVQVRVLSITGQSVMSFDFEPSPSNAEVPVGQLRGGVYIATVTDSQGHKATCKFIIR